MTPVVIKLHGRHQCGEHIIDKWARKASDLGRKCKFPALWRVNNRSLCTRHGGLYVLAALANEEKIHAGLEKPASVR